MKPMTQHRMRALQSARAMIALWVVSWFCVATAARAESDCMAACLAQHDCIMERKGTDILYTGGPNCLMFQNTCNTTCKNEITAPQGPAAASAATAPAVKNAGTFGAVAHGAKSGAWGVSKPSADQTSAAQDALGFCRQHGADCAVVAVITKECVAVATGANNIVAWSKGATPAKARGKAQAACIKKSGDSCNVAFSGCFQPQ